MKIKTITVLLTSCALLSSCSYKPILDQNEKYFQVGQVEAQKDIDKCTTDGDAYLKQYKTRRALKETGRKAVIGTVIGSTIGFLFGGNVSSLAKGAVVGTGIGAVVGGLGVVGEDKITPDEMKQRYVSNCLGRKGYQVIGWE